jgi:hypothetical protein
MRPIDARFASHLFEADVIRCVVDLAPCPLKPLRSLNLIFGRRPADQR